MLPGTTPSQPSDSAKLSGRRAAATQSPRQRMARYKAARELATTRAVVRGSAPVRGTKKPAILNLAIVAIVVPGLFCTVALPAYAFQNQQDAGAAGAELQALKESGAQTLDVGDDVVAAAVKRDKYKVTSAAAMARIAMAAEYRAYSGPSVGALLANPPYPKFSLDTIVSVAKKYQGVPYRFGGANPSGFDCSGFTQFVYAHVGISLPHSSSRQGSGGTRIARADALPGDLVITSAAGHIGIYLGGNMMIDSPRPGTVVLVRSIYDPNAWFVRYGI